MGTATGLGHNVAKPVMAIDNIPTTLACCGVGSGHEGSRVYLEVCNIALILACSRTSVCIGFVNVVSPMVSEVKHKEA